MASSEQYWIDYYKLLCVPMCASKRQIRSAYRRAALKIHPDKNKAADATDKFVELCNGLRTLTNRFIKANYDIIYEEKFSALRGADLYASFYPNFNVKYARQDPTVFHKVFVTLEEIDRGCVKTIRLCRSWRLNDKVFHFERAFFEFYVPPGCKTGATVTFPRAGDRHPYRIPADLTFVIKELSHPHFKRCQNSSHLKYCGTFTIEQAVFDREIEIQLLSGAVKRIAITDGDVQEVFVKYFRGLGLPICLNPNERGNLTVEFRFQYKGRQNKKLLLDEIRRHRRLNNIEDARRRL